jgi:cytochrome c2
VSSTLAPGVGAIRDIGHKKPWGVVALRVTSMAESFGGFYGGRWASAGESARSGREIWIHSCASCHPGPDGVAGGTKSGRPFAVVEAFAGADRTFFAQYVRNPTSLMPGAKMEAHPGYTDPELDELISFLVFKPPQS